MDRLSSVFKKKTHTFGKSFVGFVAMAAGCLGTPTTVMLSVLAGALQWALLVSAKAIACRRRSHVVLNMKAPVLWEVT